ncbi:MAG TPA: YceI family protein [Gemmatimonadaceae bacterium]|jgi:polyisoprenoid-binding protein YceI|nr:YceI family protein [Gemmatimonadaceae bacterium]
MSTAAQPQTRTTWKLDPSHTTVEFVAKHMMITTVRGRFAEFDGTIVADEANIADSSVEVTFKAASIDSRAEQRDGHLRSADFLDVENYPEVTFRSTRVEGSKEKFKVTGDLTIRDVTKPITLEATFEGMGKDPWGGTRSSFSAQGKFDRREYGLTWNVALEAGGILVSNEVKIQIEAQAVLVG